MGNQLTIAEVSGITGLHENTIYCYCRNRGLKAAKEVRGPGQEKWLIDEEDLYACEVPTIRESLDPKTVRQYKSQNQRIEELEQAIEQLRASIVEKDAAIAGLGEELTGLREEHTETKKQDGYVKLIWQMADILTVTLETLGKSKKVENAIERAGFSIEYRPSTPDFIQGKVIYYIGGRKIIRDYVAQASYGRLNNERGSLYRYFCP